MMTDNTDFFLDIFWLAVCAGAKKSVQKKLKFFIKSYNEQVKINSTLDDPVKHFCVDMINDLIENDADLDCPSDLELFLAKLDSSSLIMSAPDMIKRLKIIVDSRAKASSVRAINIEKHLENYLVQVNVQKLLNQMWTKHRECSNVTDTLEQDVLISEVIEYAKQISGSYQNFKGSELIDCIDMSNKEDIRRSLERFQEITTGTIFRTGLVGANKIFGKKGGIERGESIVFAGRTHQYKSGILMDVLRWAASLNTPDPAETKIPCIVFISLENEIYKNQNVLYKRAYTNINKCDPPPEMTNEEIVDFVHRFYNQNGFTVKIYRGEGRKFTFDDWKGIHDELRQQGYQVYMSILDYLTLVKPPKGLANAADELCALMGMISDYGHRHEFATVTAVQLHPTKTDAVISEHPINPVKYFQPSHIWMATGIGMEVDGLFFIHLEHNQFGQKFFTCAWAKHREEDITPEVDKFFAYPFTPYGIMDDVNGKPAFTRNIYDDGYGTVDTREKAEEIMELG